MLLLAAVSTLLLLCVAMRTTNHPCAANSCFVFCTRFQSFSRCCYLWHMSSPDESHAVKCIEVLPFGYLLDWLLVELPNVGRENVKKWILGQSDCCRSQKSSFSETMSWPVVLSCFHPTFFNPAFYLSHFCGSSETSVTTEIRPDNVHTQRTMHVLYIVEGKVIFILKIKGFLLCEVYLRKTSCTLWAFTFLIHSCLGELLTHHHLNNVCHESFIYSTHMNGKFSISLNGVRLKPWGLMQLLFLTLQDALLWL